jgi:hypothetical protein
VKCGLQCCGTIVDSSHTDTRCVVDVTFVQLKRFVRFVARLFSARAAFVKWFALGLARALRAAEYAQISWIAINDFHANIQPPANSLLMLDASYANGVQVAARRAECLFSLVWKVKNCDSGGALVVGGVTWLVPPHWSRLQLRTPIFVVGAFTQALKFSASKRNPLWSGDARKSCSIFWKAKMTWCAPS